MPQHLLEMRGYMSAAEQHAPQSEAAQEDDGIVVEPDESQDLTNLLEDLSTLQFKLLNHHVLEEDTRYALGYEEALNKAADMIGRIVEHYKR